jgi:HEAT repeat protein
MPASMEQVRAYLDAEEVDYNAAAAALGTDALPHLQELAQGPDPMLASKATYLASLLDDDRSAQVLELAASRTEPAVRVAAATGLANLAPVRAAGIVDRLLDDGDLGVRKMAVKSAMGFASPATRERLQKIASEDPDETMRDLAHRSLMP